MKKLDKLILKQYVKDNSLLLSEWDAEKNKALGYFSNTTTLHCNQKLWWKCDKGHSWDMSPDKRLKSKGCPYCLNKRVLVGYNDLRTLFPLLEKEWDYSKNQIDINEVVIGSAKKVHWRCQKCNNEWITEVRHRTQRGTGCPECSQIEGTQKRNNTMVDKRGAISDELLLKEWNHEKNAEIGVSPNNVTAYSNKKAWWKCSSCGHIWFAQIRARSRGSGCPVCAHRESVTGINDLCTTHPPLAKEWDYEENRDLLPQNVSYGMANKVGWKCPLGHKYKATILHRSGGTGCPICNSGKQTSFAEQAIVYYIKKIYPNAINRYRDIFNNGMELDIYIPDIRYGLEYDGSFWHTEKTQKREITKYNICKRKGIKLVRIKAFEDESENEKISYADYTFYVKEDDTYALENFIRNFYYGYYSNRIGPFVDWASIFLSVNIERDRYEILDYLNKIDSSFADEFPEVAKEWHPTKNRNSLPGMFKSGSSFSPWWLCPTCGNEWRSPIYARSKGRGCMVCRRKENSGAGHGSAKTVYQYAPNGEFIKEWGAISLAGRALNINSSNIFSCASGARSIAGGYRWSFKLFEKLPIVQKPKKSREGLNAKAVRQENLQGNIVNRFASLSEAEKITGINATSISKALNGHIKKAGGFVWKFD